MRLQRKYFIWTASVGAAGLLVWLATRERALDVDVAVVRSGSLQVTVDAEGRTRVRDRYVVTAPVSGRLERIALVEGAHVRAGDLVARIAPLPLDVSTIRQARARIDAAQSLVDDARARVQQARATLAHEVRSEQRIHRLVSAGALADRDAETATLTVRLRQEDLGAAEARARSADAEVKHARASLTSVDAPSAGASVSIRAPTDGCVLRIAERSERIVAAGAPVVELGDPAALELVVDVLSSDAARIRSGMTVAIDQWGDGEAIHGRVRTIEPAAFTRLSALGVEEQRVNVVIDVPRWPAEVSDGYRVEARIGVWEQSNVTIVPLSALFRDAGQWAVFTIVDGRAARRAVRVGAQGATGAQVLDGLAVGDTVVVFPSDEMRPGRRVRPAR